ncbi:MAG: protein kinase [Isosphaeraceae bacterium]
MGREERFGPGDCPSRDELRAYAEGPGDSEEIRRHLDWCASCSDAFSGMKSGSATLEFASAIATGPVAIGPSSEPDRYHLREAIGQGTFGIIRSARDTQLGRDVAVKTIRQDIRPEDYDVVALRFDREARITGLLQHPGIMPVLSYSRNGEGRPFYAMPLIRKATLHNEIEAFHRQAMRGDPALRSIAFRELLGRFLVVCEAVGYAHARGVIHRDLKPGNILVGDFGETLVADWGLAKVIGLRGQPIPENLASLPPIPAGIELTGEGGKLGTLGYMSPEALAGDIDRIDTRSDVYSLGAIQFRIVTGALPSRGRFPARLRAWSPLLSIADKARKDEPADRYQSAEELADEVRRWLADEPVQAHPDPPHVRLARWARRHRAPAAAILVGLLLTVVGSSVFSAVLSGKNRDLREAGERATANYQRAIAHLTRLIDSVRENITNLGSERALQAPEMDETRFRLLDGRRRELDNAQEAVLDMGDPDLICRLGNLRVDLGQIYFKQGRTEPAVGDMEAAVILARKAVELRPDDATRVFLAYALYRSGRMAHAMHDPEKTDVFLAEALDLYESFHGPAKAFDRFEVIGTIGAIEKDRMNPAAPVTLARAIAIYRDEVPEEAKAQGNCRRIYAGNLLNLAQLDLLTGVEERTRRGLDAASEALDVLEALTREEPENHETSLWAAQARWLLGEIEMARGEKDAALAAFRDAVGRLEVLHDRVPSDKQIQNYLERFRKALRYFESQPNP